ncbi:MAG: hypothetical protein KIT60_08215 [Burkholderiaceae bacterium]|nr:hypothetical protein [Burkholderiaceae bacterium]
MTVEIKLRIDERIRELNTAIGLPTGFYGRLLEEPSDWAFLIQLQVIAEAAIAQRVVREIKQDKAFDHVSRLTFDGKTGKLQLAQTLDILDAAGADALRALAACRNRFAHRITHIDGSLERFGASLDAPTKLDLLRKMGVLRPEDERQEQDAGFPQFGSKFRQRLWLSTAIALAQIADAEIHGQLLELRRDLERRQRPDADAPRPTPRTLLDFYAKSDAQP